MKVLLVDDDELFLNVVQFMLIKKGYEVVTACDVSSGVEEALLIKPDIIISDYELPDGTGLELFEEVQQSGQLPNTRRILMSTHTLNHTKPIWEAYDDGKITKFLQKQMLITDWQTGFDAL